MTIGGTRTSKESKETAANSKELQGVEFCNFLLVFEGSSLTFRSVAAVKLQSACEALAEKTSNPSDYEEITVAFGRVLKEARELKLDIADLNDISINLAGVDRYGTFMLIQFGSTIKQLAHSTK